ncbi:MAG: flagellar basal body-associated FliL family protein [Anaerolineae bacterium]|nr:flagellar basal body-associated FliL family protein [Anaerolineae bacterium]
MKKFLNPKILIPVLGIIILLGSALYVLLAPDTWWKPFYIRVEDPAAVATTQTQGDIAAPQAVTSSQTMQTQEVQSVGYFQGRQPLGIMYALDPKVVNLAEPGGLRYLKATITLELWPLEDFSNIEEEERTQAEEKFLETIDARRPKIDDIATSLLSSKAFTDIATIEGKEQLKQELSTAINDSLGYQGVVNVYFTDFVIQ